MRARILYEIRLKRRLRKRLAKKQGGGRKRKSILNENIPNPPPIVIEQAHQTLRRKHLFKYKSLNGANFDHVKEIITDSKIYCPKPSQLNDPEECRPDITVGNLSNPLYRQSIHQWARKTIALRNPQPAEEKIQAELNSITQEELQQRSAELRGEYQADIEKQYRIVSLCGSQENHYLWSAEYGDDYKGVCLGFFVDPFWGSAFKVFYSDVIPALDFIGGTDEEHLHKTILVKRKKWAAEEEYRLIFSEPPIGDDDPILVDQKYNFPPSLLQILILGHNVAAEQREELLALARNRTPKIECYTATPDGMGGVQLQAII